MFTNHYRLSVINKKLMRIGFFASLFIMTVVAVLAYFNKLEWDKSAKRVKNTYILINRFEKLIVFIQSAEVSGSGYLLSSGDDFLKSFGAAKDSIFESFKYLKTAAADKPALKPLIDSLHIVTLRRIDNLDRTLKIYDSLGIEAVKKFLALRPGRLYMNQIRILLNQIAAIEEQDLKGNEIILAEKTAYNTYTLIGGLLLSFIAFITVFALLNLEIKNRIDTEKLLTESRNWFLTTLAGIADGVIVTDENANIVFMNLAAENICGWKFDEAFKKNIDSVFRIINEATREKTESPVVVALRESRTAELSNHTILITKTGKELPVDDSAAPLIIKNQLTGAVLIFRDVSRRRALEKEKEILIDKITHTSEALLDLYNNAPCGYHSLNKRRIFVDINDTELNWLGYSRDEVINKMSIVNLLTEESIERFNKSFSSLLKNESIHSAEFEMIRKDGSILPVVLDSTALLDADGHFVKSRATIYDNTLRKETESKIKELNVFLDNVIQNANNFICVANAQFDVLIWNEAAFTLTGYSFKDVEAKNIWKLLFADPDYFTQKSGEITNLLSSQSTISNLEAEIMGAYGAKKNNAF